MPVSAARLRRWFVIALVLVCVVVGGTYLYLRHRVRNVRKQVEKLGIEVQQSAEQFTISKSVQGRTLFKLQASKAVQFKQGGRAELHDVTITLYGRDASRFDQVYGEAFDYDPQSGNVSSRGEISIDLQANPEGLLHPDQTTPKELKNPIHLKTRDLVFNKNTGDAWTQAPIEFRVPQASGSAVGAKYVAKEAELTLESQIKIVMTGSDPGTILADQALLQKAPREIVLTHPQAETPDQLAQADELTLFLNDDNKLDHVVAAGNVKMASRETGGEAVVHAGSRQPLRLRSGQASAAGATWSEVTAHQLDVRMKPDNKVKDAVLSGDVRFSSKGSQMLEGSATRALMDFGSVNELRKVHADGGVKLVQTSSSQVSPEVTDKDRGRTSFQKQNGAQDFQLTSPAMNFFVAGQKVTRAETVGEPEILLSQAGANAPSPTRITADKFTATFDAQGQLRQVHGAASARIVSPTPPQNGVAQPARVTTSDNIDALFRPGSGINAIVQQGHFAYQAGVQRAFSDTARYTPADQMLTLSGSPRIVDAGMETTARTVRLNRATGEGFADGDVKTSYSDLKPQSNGALLVSGDPVHVTAQSMAAHVNPAVATYSGNARLWQNANVIEAPSIQFQKEQRTVIADSRGDQKASTVLIGTDRKGNATPVKVTSAHLVYKDAERKVHLDGGVTVHGSDLTITAKQMEVFLAAGTGSAGEAPAPHRQPQSLGPARLDKIVASGSIVITEPNRRATGEQLVYTTSDDKFVLTGGPPSIFDAEHGKITAVSLTLFRRDGRVVVEGDSKSPAVTETQVVR